MRIRHQNLRAMAHFLKTKTEPYLVWEMRNVWLSFTDLEKYYKPWELRPEEEYQIKRQLEDTENSITRELAEHAAEKGPDTSMKEAHLPVSEPQKSSAENEQQKPDGAGEKDTKAGPELVGTDYSILQYVTPATGHTDDSPDTPHNQTLTKAMETKNEERPPNDDHGGEELVEGQ